MKLARLLLIAMSFYHVTWCSQNGKESEVSFRYSIHSDDSFYQNKYDARVVVNGERCDYQVEDHERIKLLSESALFEFKEAEIKFEECMQQIKLSVKCYKIINDLLPLTLRYRNLVKILENKSLPPIEYILDKSEINAEWESLESYSGYLVTTHRANISTAEMITHVYLCNREHYDSFMSSSEKVSMIRSCLVLSSKK